MLRVNRELTGAAYWAVTGALIGFGGLALMSIGLPFLLIGSVMAVFGLFMLWVKGVWAATVGLGGVPVCVVLMDVLEATRSSAPPCTQEGSFTIAAPSGPSESVVASCSPPMPEGYVAVLVFFGAAMLSGPAVRLFMLARDRSWAR
jgi:hypothetical protein